MNNSVFGKTMENIQKHREIKPVIKKEETIRNQNQIIVLQSFSQNKSVCLGLSITELRKTVIYEFLYNYVKPKYEEKAKLYYMDTPSFIVYIKTDNIYKSIAKEVEARFDTQTDH